MTDKQQDKIFDIYVDTVSELQKYLEIEHFEITLDWCDTHWADASIDILYKYFSATITFHNRSIYNKEIIKWTPYNRIASLFMHECFHIFCSVWTSYLQTEEDNLLIWLSKKEFALHNNAMIVLEEQMVVTLERKFIKEFIKTQEYKNLEKRYNDIVAKL